MAEHVGTRIAYWRRRRGGMTQTTLAGLAGLSQPYVSQVEAGKRSVERRSTLIALALALQVTVADLLGQPGDPANPAMDLVDASIPAIRATIVEIEEGDRRTPARPADELAAVLDRLDGMRARSEYTTMAPLVAAALADAAGHDGLHLVRAAYLTSVCLRHLGYRDLALPAARITVAAAERLEHVAWLGCARFTHTLALPIEAAPTAVRIADRSLSELQAAAADVAVRQMLGQMHLSAAMMCAVGGRGDDATAHLAAARAEAATLGDPEDGYGFNQCSFGPTNLGLWEMTASLELGEFGRVIEIAKATTPAPLKVANRHQSYWMSYGRALAHSGKTDGEALAALMRAERVAPAPFAINPMVRDTVVSIVYRAKHKSVSNDLRVLARRLGVDVPI